MTDTVNLGLPCIEGSQAQKHVTHNDALRILDTLVQLAVLDRDLTAPPGSPAEGQRWIVKATGTDAWAGHNNAVAAWQDGAWRFSTPQTGWVAFVADEGTLVVWNGTAWGDFFATVTSLQNLAMLGVGTTADTTNRLSAKLNDTLFVAKTVAEGGDGNLRYKLSKESAAKTLSFLFQDNFSGRAEVGLTGDDDFHFKVSPNGTTWYDGILIDRNTGAVSFPNTAIAGRELLTADRTYYVRTDGSDANTGLANTSGGAFLTVQKAIDAAAMLDVNGHAVTIQLADGTYTGACSLKNIVGFAAAGSLVIQGNNATPANVLISVTSADAFRADGISTVWDIKDLKITTTTSGNAISAVNGATVRWGNVNFGATANAHLFTDTGGCLVVLSNYAVSGGSNFHWQAVNGGIIRVATGFTITITGTPAFSDWAYVGLMALVNCYGLTFSGAASGPRYNIFANSAVFTNGAGASYLPGNSAGTTATGGQYV